VRDLMLAAVRGSRSLANDGRAVRGPVDALDNNWRQRHGVRWGQASPIGIKGSVLGGGVG
jgi:hypothetical protein